ncbi:MAG: PIN domain-containing protein [Methanocellales archaeon]|nr:PIN domain-containing protein [Methanocellales archaeon]
MWEFIIDPRDAIHAACAITHGIYTIISEDPDFDKIAVLSRYTTATIVRICENGFKYIMPKSQEVTR